MAEKGSSQDGSRVEGSREDGSSQDVSQPQNKESTGNMFISVFFIVVVLHLFCNCLCTD